MLTRARLAIAVSLFVTRSLSAQLVTIEGTVNDSISNQPLQQVSVYTVYGLRTQTDRAGHFRLKSVDASRDVVVFRKIGYVPVALRVGNTPGNVQDLGTVLLLPLAFQLDSLNATATARPGRRLDAFYRRRTSAKGQFFTAADIWRRNPMLTTDLLRSVSGLLIDCFTGPCHPVSRRLRRLNPARGPETMCPLHVYVDGAETSMSLDDIPPPWIAGIEIYVGAAQVPAEIGSKECGVVMIWTTGGQRTE